MNKVKELTMFITFSAVNVLKIIQYLGQSAKKRKQSIQNSDTVLFKE